MQFFHGFQDVLLKLFHGMGVVSSNFLPHIVLDVCPYHLDPIQLRVKLGEKQANITSAFNNFLNYRFLLEEVGLPREEIPVATISPRPVLLPYYFLAFLALAIRILGSVRIIQWVPTSL